MVVDTSALVAVVLGEDDAEWFLAHLTQPIDGRPVSVSTASWVEAFIVLESRQGPDATRDLMLLLSGIGSVTVPVDDDQARGAVAAWRRFGKGRHPAGLNFGDCFSYALAQQLAEPLLFKGNDFRQTDVAAID